MSRAPTRSALMFLPHRRRVHKSPGLRVRTVTYGDICSNYSQAPYKTELEKSHETGKSTRTAPGMLRTLPRTHEIAVAARGPAQPPLRGPAPPQGPATPPAHVT